MTAGKEMSCDTRSSKHWMSGCEALLLVRKVEQDVLEGVMSPACATREALPAFCDCVQPRCQEAASFLLTVHYMLQPYLWQLCSCAGLAEQA